MLYLAAEAGAVGPAKDLGCRFQRSIDGFTLFTGESKRNYDFQLPGHDWLETDRVVREISCVPPDESTEEELAACVAAANTSATKCREQEFPQAYFQHPVVLSTALDTVWPLAIYVDGTSFSKVDSILGIFVVNLATGSRHLVGTMRKNGHLQVRVQRMVLYFLRRGVRQVELFGKDVRYVANRPP